MSANLTKLRCPRCSKSLGIPRKLAGKDFPCPKCGETFSIADDLSHLRPQTLASEEEPIIAEAAEPPLAQSVEQPAPSKFPWFIVIIVGVILLTLIVIGGVVLSLPAAPPKVPAESPAITVEQTETEAPSTMEPTEEPASALNHPSDDEPAISEVDDQETPQ
ncbi:hypothetical protein [Blastopirellula marina]|uniref:Uncharacterized protein n=1 Tax=Blastopirellula marina DSM 3645 TaxID=314230 RepID=A3ZXR0_9BACT|nr:hypothetical protein [Blastopirellula marina]EAQ78602.1 hypothetical protein DSM3645_07415 [Blastopirellula marina DSM 3645]